MHIHYSGAVHVQAPPEQSFSLFTAAGEKLWVPGWEPEVMGGGDGNRKGAVWTTCVDGETTVWVVVDFDVDAQHARYARITPGVKAGTVEVRVRPDGNGGSVADVTYALTALSDRGNQDLAEFGRESFEEMLREWGDLIRNADIDYAALASPELSGRGSSS